jgi:hypothetical protein
MGHCGKLLWVERVAEGGDKGNASCRKRAGERLLLKENHAHARDSRTRHEDSHSFDDLRRGHAGGRRSKYHALIHEVGPTKLQGGGFTQVIKGLVG